MARKPREFCEAMRDLVVRSQLHPATAVGDEAYRMKLRTLDFFIERDPSPEAFERMLRERVADSDPQKVLSRGICGQILNTWRSGGFHYTSEGRLVLKALYPADVAAEAKAGDPPPEGGQAE